MRSHPSCWNKTLAQLGFKRKLRKKSKQQVSHSRRSLFENLEPRQMLSVNGSDLVAHWAFDTRANDVSGNVYDGVEHGVPAYGPSSGVFDGAIELDGSNDFIDISAAGNQLSDAWSISGWFKADGKSTPKAILGVHTSGLDNKWILNLGKWGASSTERDLLYIFDQAESGLQVPSADIAGDGEWHHFSVVRGNVTSTSSTISLFLDGKLQFSYDSSVQFAQDDKWSVGQEYDSPTPTNPTGISDLLEGSIDQLRLYNRALTPSEVVELAYEPFSAESYLDATTFNGGPEYETTRAYFKTAFC